MQPDSFKFVHVSVKQKSEKAARVRVWPNPKGPPTSTTPLEVWLPFSQCSPNLRDAPRGQTLTVGVQDWLIPNKGLSLYLTSGPATELPKTPKPNTPWGAETPEESVASITTPMLKKPHPMEEFASNEQEVLEKLKNEFAAHMKSMILTGNAYTEVGTPAPPIDWASLVSPSVTEQEAASAEFFFTEIPTQPIAPESSQEPPDEDGDILDELLGC